MSYEVVNTTPKPEDFTPLEEHQEQTPPTFFSAAKPVLHLHCAVTKVTISKADLASQADFAALQGESAAPGSADETAVDIEGVSVWVTSRYLTLFSATSQRGVQISYPTITIHALEGNAVLLELNLSDPDTADEDLEFLQLRITPSGILEHNTTHASAQANGDSRPSHVQQLYDAISACQELNPDPNPDDDDEEGGMGGFDETAPGATGWITSENMADFMDENGNFRMPEGATVIDGDAEANAGAEEVDGLGAGAGRRRAADEVDGEDEGGDDSKWQRTG